MGGLLRRIAGAGLAGLGQGIVNQAAANRQEGLLRLRRKWQKEDQGASTALTREGWDRADARAEASRAPTETFEDVDSPYGRGGVGQRSSTGRIVGYQKPGGVGSRDKPPGGYRWKADGALEAIPGGPAARKAEALEEKGEGRTGTAQRQARLAGTHIAEIRNMVKESPYTTTGMVGQWLSAIGGTEAHDLNKRIDTLKAMIGFNALNEMRSNSPTGGALGNVTERELALLQSTVASLEQSQSREQFLENLALVDDQFTRVIHGDQGGKRGATFEQMTPQQLESVEIEGLSDDELASFESAAQRAGLL